MKIDRSKLKKSSSEVPADCKGLIDRLTSTSNKAEFLSELQRIETWTYGKCELLHWIDVLDLCDEVLEAAAARPARAVAPAHPRVAVHARDWCAPQAAAAGMMPPHGAAARRAQRCARLWRRHARMATGIDTH